MLFVIIVKLRKRRHGENRKMKDEDFAFFGTFGLCVIAPMFLAGAILYDYYSRDKKFLIQTPIEKVQRGYVVPSKLEIELQDLDRNGEPETIVRYNGKNYLFTLDEQGNPRVQPYTIEVKPVESVPQTGDKK